jgi:uncharacterized repeat protein (TIGR03803 family)
MCARILRVRVKSAAVRLHSAFRSHQEIGMKSPFIRRSTGLLVATIPVLLTFASSTQADAKKHGPPPYQTYVFQGGTDGARPNAGVVANSSGVLFGTTVEGGGGVGCKKIECGTVFQAAPTASGFTESVIYRFGGGADGAHPNASLVIDGSGTLYGTTQNGGNTACRLGCGTVFKLTPSPSGYVKTTLYMFQGSDGAYPSTTLLAGASGTLFGTAGGGATGNGIVFELVPSGSNYTYVVLYNFAGGTDGSGPNDIIADASGNLYGTTYGGGAGCGTAFRLTRGASSYTESVLYSFHNGGDGCNPAGSIAMDQHGAIYGITVYGGDTSCLFNIGCGVAFSLTPSGSTYQKQNIFVFPGTSEGSVNPLSGLIIDAHGTLFGTTSAVFFRRKYPGSVYELVPQASGKYSVGFFQELNGNIINAGVTETPSQVLYGTTYEGGGGACHRGCGEIYSYPLTQDQSMRKSPVHRILR